MAVVNLGARLSGRGVPTRPWIDFWMLLKIWVTHPEFDEPPYFFCKIASVGLEVRQLRINHVVVDGLDSVVDLAQLTLGDVLRVGLVHDTVRVDLRDDHREDVLQAAHYVEQRLGARLEHLEVVKVLPTLVLEVGKGLLSRVEPQLRLRLTACALGPNHHPKGVVDCARHKLAVLRLQVVLLVLDGLHLLPQLGELLVPTGERVQQRLIGR